MKRKGNHIKTVFLILLVIGLCRSCSAETFLVTSDLHLTKDIEKHGAVLAALRHAAEDVDAVLFLGDSTNNAHEEEHANMIDFLDSLPKPAYVIPGNHDITLNLPEFIDRYADYGWNEAFSRDEETASCAVFTKEGTCLLLLDTNQITGYVAALGGISDSTCAWVSKTLSSLPKDTPVIAYGHHPILPQSRWERTPGAGQLVKALQGVKLYLCGHDHGFAGVKIGELQQITVGQPQVFPGWAGILKVTGEDFHWEVLPLYDDSTLQTMEAEEMALADNMARGTLRGTVHEDDEEAIQWFTDIFEAAMGLELNEAFCQEMLKAPGAQKWREIETRTVVKKWIFGLLENCPQDIRQVDMKWSQPQRNARGE